MGVIASAVRSTVLPRSANQRPGPDGADSVTRAAFRLRAGRSASYERRDRIMAMLGPVALLALLASWLA